MPLDFDGHRYAQASDHQLEWGRKLIEGLELRGDEQLLDLGCGDGRLTSQLADAAPRGHVVGVDASLGMLETARRRERHNLSFERLDIERLEYDSAFDVVFSNAALHFVHDHDQLLVRIHRAIRPAGFARCNFAADGNCSTFFAVVRDTMEKSEFACFFAGTDWPYYMPTVEAYRELATRAPFRQCRVWGEDADRYFPDPEAMARWIDQPAIVAFLTSVDEEHSKQRFHDIVVRRTIERARRDDGTCFETFRRVNVHAVK
jgi:trans-aconitate methyltransferase